ncbi:hypothetical protein [Hahella chejuensis]|uniref:hypothetical protein n=1 Tax=Hahella chejuensis TaxID=158327 RepID=UPI0005A2644E|nr:hypothetical protein [Hahella chejuensis]
MNSLRLWIVQSKQTNPSDFYVRVENSEFYSAYWIARSSSTQRAEALVLETAEELALGDTEIIKTQPYDPEALIKDAMVTAKIRSMSTKLRGQEDAQLAAWISSEGRLW